MHRNTFTIAALPRLLTVAAATLLVSGCISLGSQADAYYLPDYEVLSGSTRPGGGPFVFVEDCEVAPVIDDVSMIVRSSDATIVERSTTEWKVKPGEIVTLKLVEHLLASDRIGYASTGSARRATLQVTPHLRRFDEEHDGGTWVAVFGLDLEISDAEGAPLSYVRLPDVRKSAASPDPRGVANAMAGAMREGLDAAVNAIAGTR